MTTDPSVLRHGEDTPTAAGPTRTASVSWGSKTLTEADLTEAFKMPKEGEVKERRGAASAGAGSPPGTAGTRQHAVLVHFWEDTDYW